MAKIITINIKTQPAMTAINEALSSLQVSVTGSGADKWATAGSGHVSVDRVFQINLTTSQSR